MEEYQGCISTCYTPIVRDEHALYITSYLLIRDINKAEDLKGQLIPRMETDRTDTSPVREILSELNLGQYTEDQKPRFYRLKEVAAHSDFCSCWIVVHDNVYDITDFLHEHPGGWDVLMENAGTDATVAFDDKGHSKDAKELLSQYKIGELVHEERRSSIYKNQKT